ncbi:MAG: hypothetical protein LBR15_00770 [Methanobrevibacter sp.]|jgi:hypothetical protein|nr:hypothetical protein [Candidatus Methanovirga australis]
MKKYGKKYVRGHETVMWNLALTWTRKKANQYTYQMGHQTGTATCSRKKRKENIWRRWGNDVI